MANPRKAKGTGGETELVRALELEGLVRTPPGTLWDLELPGLTPALNVLATRPDRGQWLLTVDLPTFQHLVGEDACGLRIEVKRYKRFSLHSIFESKFGRSK